MVAKKPNETFCVDKKQFRAHKSMYEANGREPKLNFADETK